MGSGVASAKENLGRKSLHVLFKCVLLPSVGRVDWFRSLLRSLRVMNVDLKTSIRLLRLGFKSRVATRYFLHFTVRQWCLRMAERNFCQIASVMVKQSI